MKKHSFVRFIPFFVIFVGLGWVSSCGKTIERQAGTPETNTQQTGSSSQGIIQSDSQVFYQNEIALGVDKTDILFVFDTSASLNQERAMIIDGLERLVEQLPLTVNIQMGVLFAHATALSGLLVAREEDPIVITGTAEQMKAALIRKLNMDTGETITDGGEAGLLSLHNAISLPKLTSNQNAGFFRNDAALVVIFVSDENDICSRYIEGISFVNDSGNFEIPAYTQFCLGSDQKPFITHELLWNELQELKGDLPIILSGIIYTGETPIQTVEDKENEIGYGYKELVEMGNGLLIDLQDPLPDTDVTQPNPERIKENLQKIGQLTAQNLLRLQTTFLLQHENVIPETIKVWVDGQEVPFTYDASSHQVNISSAGNAGSQITISYNFISQF